MSTLPHLSPTPRQVALTSSRNISFCGTPPPPGSPVPWCQRSQYPLQPFPPAPTKASTHSSSRKRRWRKMPGQSSVRLFMLRSLRERSGPMSRPAVGMSPGPRAVLPEAPSSCVPPPSGMGHDEG